MEPESGRTGLKFNRVSRHKHSLSLSGQRDASPYDLILCVAGTGSRSRRFLDGLGFLSTPLTRGTRLQTILTKTWRSHTC